MKWKQKALLSKLISKLPESFGYNFFYWLQRRVGFFQSINVPFEMSKTVDLVTQLRNQGHGIVGKTMMEIGTGRTINTETGLWLCGAGKLLAVDLNPYLADDLIADSLEWMKTNRDEVINTLKPVAEDSGLFDTRLASLMTIASNRDALIELIGLDYRSPCDASKMDLPDHSIDIHFSTNVLEHIPFDSLEAILAEGKRLLKPDGVVIHRVDPSDHFAYSDSSITDINFLQFSEAEWDSLAGNKFNYHNRKRVTQFYDLFHQCGLNLLSREESVDRRSLEALESGFKVHEDFSGFSNEVLATTFFTVVGVYSDKQA